MSLTEKVLAQAEKLTGELDEKQKALLKILCGGAVRNLTARLREGLNPADCGEDFIIAAALHAAAAMTVAVEETQIQEFRAGDLTVKQGTTGRDTPAQCLQMEAERIMKPYLWCDLFFQGV